MSHQWSWRLLRAGALRLDGGGMFGVVPKALWSKLTDVDEANRIPLQTNCLLLDDGTTTVLVETGFGDKWSDKERGFYDLERRSVLDALAEAGVEPTSIDHVIVTHLHFDHAAGLTRRERDDVVPCFPNVRIHLQEIEWDDARANKAVMTRTYLANHLAPVADLVETCDGTREVLPGIHVDPVPGHTWGQQAVRFDDATGTVCFPGDVCPTANHAPAAFNMGYDVEPYTNMLTKQRLFDRAADEGWRLVLDHEPGHPLRHVARDPERRDRFTLPIDSSRSF